MGFKTEGLNTEIWPSPLLKMFANPTVLDAYREAWEGLTPREMVQL